MNTLSISIQVWQYTSTRRFKHTCSLYLIFFFFRGMNWSCFKPWFLRPRQVHLKPLWSRTTQQSKLVAMLESGSKRCSFWIWWQEMDGSWKGAMHHELPSCQRYGSWYIDVLKLVSYFFCGEQQRKTVQSWNLQLNIDYHRVTKKWY